MGKPMAKHLSGRAPPDRAQPQPRRGGRVVAAGATAAAAPAEVARASTVVITMLPDTPDVERVLTGPDGVLSGLQAGAVVIDMSSISPVATKRLAALVAEQGGTMLDAPVSGGEIGAVNATLSIMVGGAGGVRRACGRSSSAWATPSASSTSGVRRRDRSARSATRWRSAARSPASARRSRSRGRPASTSRACARRCSAGSRRAACSKCTANGCSTGNYKPGFRARLYQKDLRHRERGRGRERRRDADDGVVTQLINALVASGGGDLDYAALGTVCSGWLWRSGYI